MAFLGALCGVIAIMNMRPWQVDDLSTIGWPEVVWPANPYSLYRFATHSDSAHGHSTAEHKHPVVVMIFVLSFLLSLISMVSVS